MAQLPALLLIPLYMLVDFIPQFSGADVMGAQWLYLSIIHVLAGLYFLTLGKNTLKENLPFWALNPLSLLILGFTTLAGVSVINAINPIESVVVYARLLTTVLMYFNLGLLLQGRLTLFKPLSYFLTLLLLIQCLQVVSQFYSGIEEGIAFDTVISEIKVNTGNKNILAASLAIKIPFVIYALLNSSKWYRWILAVILSVSIIAIAIVNARSSFVAIGAQLMVMLAIYLVCAYKNKEVKTAIKNISWVLLPVIAGFLASTLMLNAAIEIEEGATGFNTITERVTNISFTAAGSSGRTTLWSSAVDYISNHPLQGAGYGNWKLASIPYEKETIDELFVAYHAHNDFLEMTAETGWAGGILYLSIFIACGLYLLRILLKKASNEYWLLTLCIAMALASYFTDATFNFPVERPIMQFFLAFILSSAIAIWRGHTKNPPSFKKLFLPAGIFLLLLTPSLWMNAKVYTSMKGQYTINSDVLSATPVLNFEDVNRQLPALPNLNAFCFPIDVIKSRYLLKEKKYTEALEFLNRSRGDCPALSINEFYTAQAHLGLLQNDSAYYWAQKAFDYRPRARNNYLLLNDLLVRRRDSAGIEKAFKTVVRLRNEAWVWDTYLGSLAAIGLPLSSINPLVDSAYRNFPNDSNIINRYKYLANQKAKKDFEAGTQAYLKNDYPAAITYFIRTTQLNPFDYANFENVGMSYYAQKDFSKAIEWFDKVIAMGTARDAKSVFFKGLCLLSLGQQQIACQFINAAVSRQYPGAAAIQAEKCK